MTTRNITTLSLITIAILSLNGCGGDSSSTKSSEQSVSSITKLSEASKKHSNTDWEVLTGQITDLDKPEKFNTMLSTTTEKNVALLTNVGINKEEAYAINSDMMYDDLVELDIQKLDEEVTTECQENEICKEEAYASIGLGIGIDKEEAYAMAEEVRGIDKEEAYAIVVNDGLVKEFSCDAGEVKTVRHYGLEDVFSTANGVEPTHQYPSDIDQNMINYNNNVNAGFANYDETHNNRLFLDDINNLPAGVTSGRFYIGLKSNGSSLQGNDTISLGDFSGTNDRYAKALTGLQGDGWQEDLVSNSNPTTAIYSNDLSNIRLNMQAGNTTDTLLTLVQNNQRFGAYVQDDTSVDFITVATCSKKDPIKEIETVVNKFECSEKETMMKILGGEIDALAPGVDSASPSTSLDGNVSYYQLTGYDQTSPNKTLLDTLDLSNVSGTITKAEFNLGYKSLGNPLTGNDTVHIGEYGVNHSGGRYILYPNGTNTDEPLWGITSISNGEIVRKVNLADINPTATPSMTMLDWIQGKSAFDVVVEDDTAVDFAQLNLCVAEKCGEDVEIDLSQLANWTNKPSDAVENNVFNGTQYQGVWDDTLNWFDFENSHSDEVLEIPFCACGDTLVDIKHFKADNNATIKLDSTLVASQQGADQLAMIRDDMTKNGVNGNHVDGTQSVAGTGTGVNHTLRVDVHNFGSEFGVAMKGTLKFRGHLGQCAK